MFADGFTHAMELQYDHKKEKPGINGQPVFLKIGTKWPLDKGVNLHTQLLLGERAMFGEKWDFPVTDSLKVTATTRCDLKNLVTDPDNADWQHGIGLEFTL